MTGRMLVTIVGIWAAFLSATIAQADTRDLRVEGKKPAEFVASQTGKSWAVVIGINDYEKVRRLTYAVPDAQAMAQTLEQRGFQVATLYNAQATRRAIVSELGTKLGRRIKPDDRVVIYYAGHGEEEKVVGGKEMGYLVPVDGELEDLAGTGVSMGLIKELADALPAKQVLFLVDVCYGGIAGQQFRSLPKMTDDYLRIITRERGRQLITAGGADQQAMEGPEWGHSVFTYYLLEGLNKGHADLNNDGIIPASELYAYLNERVFSAANLKGHQQRPELWALAAEKGEFVFFTDRGSQVSTLSASVRQDAGNSVALDEERRRLQVERQALQGEREAVDQARRQAEEQARLTAERAQVDAERKRVEAERQQLQIAKAPTYAAPRQQGREMTGKDGAPMVLVPAGEFQYGSDNRRMSLPAFYMDKYEVTTSRYAAFMQATGRKQPNDWDRVSLASVGDRPVVGVDWHDADAYCRHYGKRLPTEQEWEKAARGPDGRAYPWGNEEPTSRLALFQTTWNGYATLAMVESYEAGRSPYGLYHMAGNVDEWTSSDYDSGSKVVRGGSWDYVPMVLRSADRLGVPPSFRVAVIGFRCAQDARN